jgi:endonuclease/exonuclease/phosphatase family metal-dependent hydrolase
MFSFSPRTSFHPVDGATPFSGLRRYEVQRGGMLFNVAGVWPWATRTAKTSYRQAHDALVLHRDWIRQRPTVLLGDFNASASYEGRNWQELIELIRGLELTSAYHRFTNQEFGREADATHFHRGKRSSLFHLDYCFVPEAWASRILSVKVGTFDDWHTISDHAPLVVDLSL